MLNMIDPNDPEPVQIAKQARIIDALIRRSQRQKNVGPSAYSAFQSAIDLQQKVAAQTRELESARTERERTRRALVAALASMEGGLALFSDGALDICNDLFRTLLPDISRRILPGLKLVHFLRLMGASRYLVSADGKLGSLAEGQGAVVLEVPRDRWYQLSAQRTSSETTVLLLTEITALVRENRRQKEHLIDRQADYLQAVFQNMTSGVCTFSATGEVMMQNGRFCDLLGVPLRQLRPGTVLADLLDFMRERRLVSEDTVAQLDRWRDELRRKGSVGTRVKHGADRVLDVQVNAMPDGGFLVELKDVTLETRSTQMLENRVAERTRELTEANARLTEQYEQKARVEEELRLAKERAEAAVSSKTRFLAAASHDLLQPVNAAKLLISTLQESVGSDPLKTLVQRLEGAFSSAEYLLHSLLDISRLESADPDAVTETDVSLRALMEGVQADQMWLAAQKSVRLDVVPSSAVVRSDPVYLLRSVQNLVVNAIQYTPPGGRVVLGCRRRAGEIVLEVWDTGVGIPAADQQRIFEEFARAGDVSIGGGVGLGLSVVDRACKLLGHRLSVRSKPGCGSVFSIGMCEARCPAYEVMPPALPRTVAPIAGGTEPLDHIVMIIENDADVLFGATQRLELWGASVLAVRSTAEALQQVAEIGMPPDVILADYQLDGADTGVIATREVRAVTGVAVPAILITADRSEGVRRIGQQNDMAVMTKPAELGRLRALINWKLRGDDAALHAHAGLT